MASFSVLLQLYLAYGTFLAYPLGGTIACVSLIVTGLPFYLYFQNRRLKGHVYDSEERD
jgi:hypothetical protein